MLSSWLFMTISCCFQDLKPWSVLHDLRLQVLSSRLGWTSSCLYIVRTVNSYREFWSCWGPHCICHAYCRPSHWRLDCWRPARLPLRGLWSRLYSPHYFGSSSEYLPGYQWTLQSHQPIALHWYTEVSVYLLFSCQTSSLHLWESIPLTPSTVNDSTGWFSMVYNLSFRH